MAGKTLDAWVDHLQIGGRYSFRREEALRAAGLTPAAVSKALQRLARKGRVLKLKDYFYVIVPLEYRSAGGPPPSWYIAELMTAMRLPYYVGLLTAAGLHGASHQQAQEFQVLTDRSVRPIALRRGRIRFFATRFLADAAVGAAKTPTGPMRVSTPETTAVDLVRFARYTGHLDYVATVIAELAPLLRPQRLVRAVAVTQDVPNAQRLGYILDRLDRRGLSDAVHRWLGAQSPRLLPLRPAASPAAAREVPRWRLLVDEPVEVGN